MKEKPKNKPKADQPERMTLKDYQRKVVLERGGQFSDDEDEEDGGMQSHQDEKIKALKDE